MKIENSSTEIESGAVLEAEPEMQNNIIYDDSYYVKRNTYASCILFIKMISTLPFNIIGLLYPENIHDLPWLLFMEAFYHYHTRIFYLLAFHRNMTQAYCAFFSNGLIQQKILILESFFDIGLVVLYVHEYYALHNINALFSSHCLIHIMIATLSFHSVIISCYKTKTQNLA